MHPELDNYLDRVGQHLHLDSERKVLILREVSSHLEETYLELRSEGLTEAEALTTTLDSFGRPRFVARLMHESHHKVTWPEMILSAVPHLLVAFLFALNGWDSWFWAPILLVPVVAVTLYGWWQGKPNWLYPWVGYSMIPLVIAGYLSLPFLPDLAASFLSVGPESNPWALMPWVIFLPLTGWLLATTTFRVARRDWMLASLMLFPLPVAVAWLILLEDVGGLFSGAGEALHQYDYTMMLVQLASALTTVIFIRLRGGPVKVGALALTAFGLFTGILHSSGTDMNLFYTAAAGVFIFAFFLSPAILESVAEKWESRRRGLGAS